MRYEVAELAPPVAKENGAGVALGIFGLVVLGGAGVGFYLWRSGNLPCIPGAGRPFKCINSQEAIASAKAQAGWGEAKYAPEKATWNAVYGWTEPATGKKHKRAWSVTARWPDGSNAAWVVHREGTASTTEMNLS